MLLLLSADSNGGRRRAVAHRAGAPAHSAPPHAAGRFCLGVTSALRCSSGDSIITPAISVLSAVEGLKLVTPAFEHYVMPLTVVILILAIRSLQRVAPRPSRRSSSRLWSLWFVSIADCRCSLHIQ